MENKDLIKSILNEAGAAEVKNIGNELLSSLRVSEPALAGELFNVLSKDMTLTKEIPILSKIKNYDELVARMKSGEINSAESQKIFNKLITSNAEMANKVRAYIGESPAMNTLAKQVFTNGPTMRPDAKNLEIAQAWLKKTYNLSPEESEILLKKALGLKGDVKATYTTVQAVKGTSKIVQVGNDILSRIKNKFKNMGDVTKSKWFKFIGLGALAAGGYGLYHEFTKDPETEINKVMLPDCVNALLNTDGSSLVKLSDGSAVAVIKNTGNPEYDRAGGLYFYKNGRVMMGNKSKMGSYTCNGTQTAVHESLTDIYVSLLSEQDAPLNNYEYTPGALTGNKLSGVTIKWDGTKSGGVRKPKSQYHGCTGFPQQYGCKSNEVKEIQQMLNMPEKYQTGNFGPITLKAIQDSGLDILSTNKEISQNLYDTLKERTTSTQATTTAEEPPTGVAPSNPQGQTTGVTPKSNPQVQSVQPQQNDGTSASDNPIANPKSPIPDKENPKKPADIQENVKEIKKMMKKILQ